MLRKEIKDCHSVEVKIANVLLGSATLRKPLCYRVVLDIYKTFVCIVTLN